MRIIGIVFAVLVATGCLPPAGTYGAFATAGTTGVYINGQEMGASDKAQLDDLVGGTVPAGRYYVDATGMMGVEGGAPVVNLVALARARGGNDRSGGDFNMYSRDTSGNGSSIVSQGKCTILSTPTGSLSSGC